MSPLTPFFFFYVWKDRDWNKNTVRVKNQCCRIQSMFVVVVCCLSHCSLSRSCLKSLRDPQWPVIHLYFMSAKWLKYNHTRLASVDHICSNKCDTVVVLPISSVNSCLLINKWNLSGGNKMCECRLPNQVDKLLCGSVRLLRRTPSCPERPWLASSWVVENVRRGCTSAQWDRTAKVRTPNLKICFYVHIVTVRGESWQVLLGVTPTSESQVSGSTHHWRLLLIWITWDQ